MLFGSAVRMIFCFDASTCLLFALEGRFILMISSEFLDLLKVTKRYTSFNPYFCITYYNQQ